VSGDEFVCLCEDLRNVEDAHLLAERICSAFTSPFSLDSAVITITASVGIAYAGPGEEISADLMSRADAAMYQAKHDGGGTHRVIDIRTAPPQRKSQRVLEAAPTAGAASAAHVTRDTP